MKKSLIIIGACLVVFGLSWHFIQIFQTGTIFLLNEICESHVVVTNPAAGRSEPQWMLDGACMWLPFAVTGSYASIGVGVVLIITIGRHQLGFGRPDGIGMLAFNFVERDRRIGVFAIL